MSAAAPPLAAAARYWRAAAAVARATDAETAIGATRSDVALRRGKLSLRRYRARAAPAGGPALLIVHGRVGRASVTDLAPDRSLVGDLLDRGADVWTIHWGTPSRADRFRSFADHVLDDLAACVGAVARGTGRPPALLGVCEGGIFALCLAALAPRAVSGVAAAVTPVDFHADPDALLTRWICAFAPEDLARLIDVFGHLPGGMMGAIFQAMTPARTTAKYTHDLLDVAEDPDALRRFLRMERWLADRPDHPGEAAKTLLIDLYHANALARGALELDGRRVDLGAIRAPVLSALGLRDHIVPPACARALGGLLDSALRHDALEFDAGHVGVFAARRAGRRFSAAVGDWLVSL